MKPNEKQSLEYLHQKKQLILRVVRRFFPWSLVQSWLLKKMPVREDLDDSPLIVIRQISTEEDPIPPPSTSHVPIIESYTP